MASYKNPLPTVESDEQIKNGTDVVIVDDYSYREPVYFAFIDVLGFKKTFDDNREKNGNEFADKYREVFNYYFELMDAANFMVNKENTGCYAGQTSDSLYFYTPRSDMLIEFIKIFSHFHLYAMTKNIFFRGGIAKGKLFLKKEYQFYGDSVINAFLLESMVSKHPIIVIDESTYQDIKDIKECDILIKSMNERHYIRPFVYLKEKINLDINEISLINIRETDKNTILENIKMNKKLFEYDCKNFEKYVFLMKEFSESVNNNGKK